MRPAASFGALVAAPSYRITPSIAFCLALLGGCVLSGQASAVNVGAPLRIGTSGDYPPFSEATSVVPTPAPLLEGSDITIPRELPTQSFPKENNPPVDPTFRGFDIEVAKRFAADTEHTVDFLPFRWPDLPRQVSNKALDLAMSGITLRPERASYALQSRPYLVTGAVTVVREEDGARFRDRTWLDAQEVRIAVNRGGYLERVARRELPKAQIIPVDDNRRLPALLAARQVDAVVAERFEALAWQQKGLRLSAPFTHDAKGYLAPAGSLELMTQLDDWLAARERDGWLDRLRKKWFGDAGAISARDLCGEALRSRLGNREALMPQIAAAKEKLGLGVEDEGQEMRVIARARTQAAEKKLDPEPVATLFRALIQSAKVAQFAALLVPKERAPQATLPLEKLRAAVADASTQLIAEIDRCEPYLKSIADDPKFRDAARPPDLETRIWGAIGRVRRVGDEPAN